MLRCWECKTIVIVPERDTAGAYMYSQSHTVEVTCQRCGSMYMITTTKKAGRVVIKDREEVNSGQ